MLHAQFPVMLCSQRDYHRCSAQPYMVAWCRREMEKEGEKCHLICKSKKWESDIYSPNSLRRFTPLFLLSTFFLFYCPLAFKTHVLRLLIGTNLQYTYGDPPWPHNRSLDVVLDVSLSSPGICELAETTSTTTGDRGYPASTPWQKPPHKACN